MLITIGRECGCGGDALAAQLAAAYGLPCLDRAEIERRARGAGLYDSYPYFFGEIPTNFSMNAADGAAAARVLDTPRRALAMLPHDCVIVGRAANAAFRGREDALRVFLCAPLPHRIAHIAETHGIPARKAARLVEDTDERRRRYHLYYTGEIWGQADGYDLCLDIAALGEEGAAAVIAAALRARSERQGAGV